MGTERTDRSGSTGGLTPARRATSKPGVAAAVSRAAVMVGNRGMGRLVQRAPLKTGTPPKDPKAGQQDSGEATAADVLAAEAWIAYIAQRGHPTQPTQPFPERWRTFLQSFNDAVFGARDEAKKTPVRDAQLFLGILRAMHDERVKTKDYKAFELADVALKRAAINAGKQEGELSFDPTGATEYDQGLQLSSLWTRADDEIREAREMGYTIPEELSDVSLAAHARWTRANKSWKDGSPSDQRQITPEDEESLVKFRTFGLKTIGDMHAKRAADLARWHAAEAAALEAASEKQMAQLRGAAADRRRALFHQGEKGKLAKLHEAIGEITGTIDEMKGAARLITKRVDQLNSISQMVSKEGGKAVNLPEIPKNYTDVADKLKSMNGKLGKVLELMEIAGPGKTQLEDGERYLKGLEMALDHFVDKLGKGNPFIAVYVNAYLKPGIDNCVASLNKIAEIESSQNRSILESGDPGALAGMYWGVELGGEDAYLFISQVFKVGGAAAIDDTAWEYFSDHADDLSAAVGETMPNDRRALGAWAARNRYHLWESFYGSVRPPR